MEEEMITISVEEYERLKEDSKLLECLDAAGIDNWDGYSYALEMFHEHD